MVINCGEVFIYSIPTKILNLSLNVHKKLIIFLHLLFLHADELGTDQWH